MRKPGAISLLWLLGLQWLTQSNTEYQGDEVVPAIAGAMLAGVQETSDLLSQSQGHVRESDLVANSSVVQNDQDTYYHMLRGARNSQ